MRYLLMLLVLVLACTNPPPGTPFCEAHGRTVAFRLDERWSAEERAAITSAAGMWAIWTSGKATVEVRDDAPHRIVRLMSTDEKTKELDAKGAARRKIPEWIFYGELSADGNIYIVVDRSVPESLYFVTAHELGHAIGLEWPFDMCPIYAPKLGNTDEYDCHHTADPMSLMYGTFNAKSFNETDLAFCRASCLCP